MVSIETSNIYEIRSYLVNKAVGESQCDAFKFSFLNHLNLCPPNSDFSPSQLYKRCAIQGLTQDLSDICKVDFDRLLGQAHTIDGTPSPWVSDIWGVLGIKWAVEKSGDVQLMQNFQGWVKEFLPQRISEGRLNALEKTIGDYILGYDLSPNCAPCGALFLHFQNCIPIQEQSQKDNYAISFLDEFKSAYRSDYSPIEMGLIVYVFDRLNQESALVPPNNWSLNDIVHFLETIPVGLRKWTWEESGKTKGSEPVKWYVQNEYHVQNLLYVLLAPIFKDITDEVYTEPVGQKTPRIDLYLPSAQFLIEVKFRKDNKKSFQSFIGEIAEDVSLYRSDPKFINSKLIIFLWDNSRSTQEHEKFKEGVLKINGIDGCIVICSPSVMD